MRMPTSRSGGARFRGPTSSHEYNQNEHAKYLELAELYKTVYENYQALKEAHQIILHENNAFHNYAKMLEQKIKDLELKIQYLEDNLPNKPVFFKTAFVQDMTTKYINPVQDEGDTSSRCEINDYYRFVTLPIAQQIPKTHMINHLTQQAVIPKELKVSISRTNEGGEVIDNDIYNAFNGDNHSYWQRLVTYDINEAPEEEDAIIEIELPTRMVNNLNVNTIYVHPHPERNIVIENLEVEYNNSWEQVKGFHQQDVSFVDQNQHSARSAWFFPSIPVKKIRLTLKQKNPIQVNDKKIFVLGAQEIGVYLTLFEKGGGIVLTPFEMDGLYNVEYVEHIFSNQGAFSFDNRLNHQLEGNLFEYDLLKEEQDGMLVPLSHSEWSGLYARRIWVRTRLFLDPYNGVNPCLHAIRLHYSR